ncbi:MAG: AraC-like DNA-binding protein [Arenicella sp.]|jgi:AraC-like DNA-binding protein
MNAVNQLFAPLKLEANVFHNGQYCGAWAVDISGAQKMTFHVVVRGTCYLKVAEQVIKLGEGDAVFFPNDSKHVVSNFPNQEIELNSIESQPMSALLTEPSTGLVCGDFGHQHPLFERILKQLPEVILIRSDPDSASSKIVDLVLEESASSGYQTSVLLNRLSDCLFLLMVRDHLDVESGIFAGMSHPKLMRAIALIHGEPDQKISLEQLAAEALMSRSAFSTLFKSIVGQSPMDYLKQWRITVAYRWLVDDGISTYDAALRCGYESESSFSKAFASVMGFGPGKARAELRR